MYFPSVGATFTLLISSRMSSTPLLEAASISIISGLCSKDKQALHFPQASPSTKCSQLIVLAKTLAVLVLPVPRGPVNKYE